jgi:hypothetical protein
MNRFTFVAYKEDSADYCRNCLMASYESHHVVSTMITEQELIKEWAKCLLMDSNARINERTHDYWIFKNGIKVWEGSSPSWDGEEQYEYNSDEYWSNYNDLEDQKTKDETLINRLFVDATHLAEELEEQQTLAKAKT